MLEDMAGGARGAGRARAEGCSVKVCERMVRGRTAT